MKRFSTAVALFALLLPFFVTTLLAQSPLIYAALSDENNIAIVDPGSSKLLRRIQVGRYPAYVALNADKSRLYVSNTGDITVSILNIEESRVSQVLRLPVNRRGVYAGFMIRSWDGKRMYVAEHADDPKEPLRVYVIDAEKENVIGQFDAGTLITALGVSADGSKVFVVNNGQGVGVFDATSYKRIGAVKLLAGYENKVYGIAVSPVKDLAYITYGNANKVQAINTASYANIATVDMPKYHTGMQKDIIFGHDGRYAFVLNHKDSYKDIEGVNVIDAAKNEVIKIFNSGEVLRGISVSSDGRVVYVASSDLKWYDMNTLEHIRSISLRTTIGDIVVVD